MPDPHPLTIPCPVCGAAADTQCASADGRVHLEREARALAQLKAPTPPQSARRSKTRRQLLAEQQRAQAAARAAQKKVVTERERAIHELNRRSTSVRAIPSGFESNRNRH